MRSMEFKMERAGLISVGEQHPVTEYVLPRAYYYVLGSSYAMSENIPKTERIKSRAGIVTDIRETVKGFYVTVEFDED